MQVSLPDERSVTSESRELTDLSGFRSNFVFRFPVHRPLTIWWANMRLDGYTLTIIGLHKRLFEQIE